MNRKLRIIIALLLTTALFILSSCGKKESPAPNSSPKNTEVPTTLTNDSYEEKKEPDTVIIADDKEAVQPEQPDITPEPITEATDNPEEKIKTVTVTVTDDKEQIQPEITPKPPVEEIPVSEKEPEPAATDTNEEELLEFELLDTPIACKTYFFRYASEKEAVFDLLSMAQNLGYVMDEDNSFMFSNTENTLQVGFEGNEENNGYKICKTICYGKKDAGILCTFERNDRYDGSTLYSLNSPDNYTVSMDQILLLTYIMENLSDVNQDPLADLFTDYYNSGIYRFPVELSLPYQTCLICRPYRTAFLFFFRQFFLDN